MMTGDVVGGAPFGVQRSTTFNPSRHPHRVSPRAMWGMFSTWVAFGESLRFSSFSYGYATSISISCFRKLQAVP